MRPEYSPSHSCCMFKTCHLPLILSQIKATSWILVASFLEPSGSEFYLANLCLIKRKIITVTGSPRNSHYNSLLDVPPPFLPRSFITPSPAAFSLSGNNRPAVRHRSVRQHLPLWLPSHSEPSATSSGSDNYHRGTH